MRRFLQTAYAADKMWLKMRWGLLAIWAFAAFGSTDLTVLLGGVVFCIATGVYTHRQIAKFDHYSTKSKGIPQTIRFVDLICACGSGILGGAGFANVWLLAIPTIIFEGVSSRSTQRVLILTAMGCGLVGYSGFDIGSATHAIIGCVSIAGSGGLGLLLAKYQAKDRTLHDRDRRLTTIMNTAGSLAASGDLKALILNTLKSSIHDIGFSAGIICLVSEEDKNLLVTEAAYSTQGDFYFPLNINLGDGVSGYVAKMGQPITLTAKDNENLDCDQIGVVVKSAVSIPLINREFSGNGVASTDTTIGSMTLVSTEYSDGLDAEDLDLLQSLTSLLANAIHNARMEERSRATFLRTLESLATALEARDDYTRGHSQRVCDLSVLIGTKLGLLPDALEELRIGTILHDIGKIGVPDAILNKPGRLTDEEFMAMKAHPVIGYEICRPLMLSEGILMIIRNHHEKLDGSGYPDGLKGGELPLSLRIVCVADAFDAMSSRRPYRGVMDINVVIGELSKGAGIQFDPVVVEGLKQLLLNHELDDIYAAYWQPNAVEDAKLEEDKAA